jgi:Zn-dependent peptidase ImmA (M78 family)
MSGPEDQAKLLLRRFEVTRPPVAVDDIADALGALIVRNNFDGSESGFTLRDGKRIIIGINTRTSRKRQRFSIAHEIGHVIMHPLNPLIVDHSVRMDWRDGVSSLGTNRQEIEANAFAAALLMPQDMVINSVKKHASESTSRDDLISELAHIFDVSTEAMGFRLINLGILAPLHLFRSLIKLAFYGRLSAENRCARAYLVTDDDVARVTTYYWPRRPHLDDVSGAALNLGAAVAERVPWFLMDHHSDA